MAAFNFPDPTVQQTVTNPITGSTYQWKEPPGKWVVTTKAPAGSNIIYEGDNPPIPRGDYKLWYSTDTLELYFWYEDVNGNGAWVPTAAPITMLEDLDNSVFELRQDLTAVNVAVRENENQIGRTIYFSDTAPTIYDDTVYDGVAYPNELNYKFWYDTVRLELLILFRDEDGDDSYVPVSIPLESLPESDISDEVLTYTIGQIQRTLDEIYLKNIQQDDRLTENENDIIELEEEIEALAPSLERGKWNYNPLGSASTGQYSLYDSTGNITSDFNSVATVFVNTVDSNSITHGFGDVKEGTYLEVFQDTDADYGVYVITDVDDQTGGNNPFWIFTVDFVRSNSLTSTAGGLARFKIFEAPSGGDVSEFVKKSGDTMTGDLDIDRSTESTNVEAALALTGSRPNTTNSAATIAFENSQSSDIGYLTYRSFGGESFFKLNRDLDLNNKGLRQIGEIRMTPGGFIGAGSNQRLTFNNASSGNEATGLLVVPRPIDNRRSFVIRGNDADGDEKDMFYSYSNAFGTPDAINYVGKMDSDDNLVNKSYVDDKMAELLAKIEELEMTSGTTESYQFRMNNKTTGGSSSIGSQLFINDIMSCDNDGDEWNGQNTHLLSSEYRHIYVCFEDGYRLNSTGQMSVVRYSNSNQYDVRNSNVGTFNISGVEVCPPDKSAGKNIYRAVIQLDAYKPGTDAFYPSWGQGNVYITFSGGSLFKVS